MVDTPTNNFCTWNSVDSYDAVLSEGNLKTTSLAAYDIVLGTFAFTSGKWYWEQLIESSTVSAVSIGSTSISPTDRSRNAGGSSESIAYYTDGRFFWNDAAYSSGSPTFGNGDIISIKANMDTGDITWYKNNSFVKTISVTWDEMTPAWSIGSGAAGNSDIANFGQDSSFAGNKTAQGKQDSNDIGDFYYTPPSGFLALCTKNLPDPAVIPSEHFNTVLYTGNNSAQSISSVGFQPDLVWMKSRSSAQWHRFADSIRGGTKILYTNSASAEASGATLSFDSDGFSFAGANGTNANDNTVTYVAWNWKAGGAGGTGHTQGTISSTASVNADAGFSIVKYTGTGSSGTVGHGLGVEPDLIISKSRDALHHWWVHGNAVGTVDTNYLLLQETYSLDTATNVITSIDATTISIDTNAHINTSGHKYIQYYFKSIDGYSKAGTYTGNGSADGTFVYTGFRPAYVMLSNTATSGEGFVIFNNKADPYNVHGTYQVVYDSAGEQGTQGVAFSRSVDFLSNGFKWRGSSTEVNQSGVKHIFLAFAESPFKHTNAR
jgi:hypothetical protein